MPVAVPAQISDPSPTVAGSIRPATSTIAQALDDYLADLSVSSSPEYVRSTRIAITLAAKRMGVALVRDLTPEAVRGYLLAGRTAGRKPRTLKNYRDHLDRFGGWLVRQGLIAANPVGAVPRVRVPKSQARLIPTDDEVRRLILWLRPRKQQKDLWLRVLLHASVPIRYGTSGQLTREHCRLDGPAPRLEVPAAITKGRRDTIIPLPPEVAQALRDHINAGGCRPDGRIFRAVCKPQSFKALVKRAGLRQAEGDRTLSWHSLKHYASNRRMRLGWTREERRIANDHTTVRMTEEVYTDPEAARRFDPGLAAVLEKTARMPPLLSPVPTRAYGGGPIFSQKSGLEDSRGACVRAEGQYAGAAIPNGGSSVGYASPNHLGDVAAGPAAESPQVSQPAEAHAGPAATRRELGASGGKSGREDLNKAPGSAPASSATPSVGRPLPDCPAYADPGWDPDDEALLRALTAGALRKWSSAPNAGKGAA
jgi:integrase